MNTVLLQKVTAALRESWSVDTSSTPAWAKDNPSIGQCAVTALIVQDYLGGEIVNAKALYGDVGVSHYFNLIEGELVDLTKGQFKQGTKFADPMAKTGNYATTREYCLSFPDTRTRYELLASRVTAVVGQPPINE
ncbi:MAG TPA: hypothetical protein VN081_01290 [Dongiaceae bacterium]|nr:hypothetical protein [Dongiaceae bacterium]